MILRFPDFVTLPACYSFCEIQLGNSIRFLGCHEQNLLINHFIPLDIRTPMNIFTIQEVSLMRKFRILIVDDQKRTRDSLKALFSTWEEAGEIQEATNGLEAIGQVQVFCPDIIVMDVRMCRLDGIQTTQFIKQNTPDVKIVILSIYQEYDVDAMRACADAFVSKGESPERLLNIVQMVAAGIETEQLSRN